MTSIAFNQSYPFNKSPYFIAEISNHHGGDMAEAKKLILAAKESGADAVKGQAFVAEDMMKWGKMPLSFYLQCAFSYAQYKELIDFGDHNNIPVFFTIISQKFARLSNYQPFKKIFAGKAHELDPKKLIRHYDYSDVLISMNTPIPNIVFHHANVLYATAYGADVDPTIYDKFKATYPGTSIGISHHCREIDSLIETCDSNHVRIIEKHFFLGKKIEFLGQLYRDCTHSFNPKEFENLVKTIRP